jgi:hypothetical protein
LTVVSALFGSTRIANRDVRSVLTVIFALGLAAHLVVASEIAVTERKVVDERTDVFQRVKEADAHDAIVFLSTGTGVRRPMQVRDLTRNGIDLSGNVLYALDLGEQNERLMRTFPGKTFFRYVRNPRQVKGRLEPLAPTTIIADAK